MRNRIIINDRAEKFNYEIRGITPIAQTVERFGVPICWENIGDPILKGKVVPAWIREIVSREAKNPTSYAYAESKGLTDTRVFLARLVNRRRGTKISPEDICFFNGLGDAISKIYGLLDEPIRIIGPTPAYSTHSSAEAANAGAAHITYELDPHNGWQPNLEELEMKVKYNPNISGILLINPNNPTGAVYSKETLERIVAIAKKYDTMVISDEIYLNIAYGTKRVTPLSDVIGTVPGIAMKGISKELPWPGARCGWLEFYNTGKDATFDRYVKAIMDNKMIEVASTTLPQRIIPRVMGDARYRKHLEQERKRYRSRANLASTVLGSIEGLHVVKPQGAFYLTAIFKDDALTGKEKLAIGNNKVRQFIEKFLKSRSLPEERFAYYLLGATGICVVPLSGFESRLPGFRMTLLENDSKKFKWILETMREKLLEFTA